jgi:toxin ParE1/3/4
MRRIIFAKQARKDLVEIWKYICKDNADAAGRVIDRVEAAVRDLAEMPGMGHIHHDIVDPRYRVWRVYSYLIAYRADAKTLNVARIIHGARRLRKLFPPGD